MAESSGVDPS